MKLLVLNGPNINMLGTREPGIYGNQTYDELVSITKSECDRQNVEADFFQSNHEGGLIDAIQKARRVYDGIIFNPAAYTHTSIALLDALKAVDIPVVEVHISDTDTREDFRKISYTGLAAAATVKGHGISGYPEAVRLLKDCILMRKQQIPDTCGNKDKNAPCILDVPYLSQSGTAPTGCESVSTVMLLNYLGIDISIKGFIDTYLPREHFRAADGETLECSILGNKSTYEAKLPDGRKLFGPDPFKSFAGDPGDPDAFGCYAPVIVSALNRLFHDYMTGDIDKRCENIRNDSMQNTPGDSAPADAALADAALPESVPADAASEGIKNCFKAVDESGKNLYELALYYIGKKKVPFLSWCTIDQKEAEPGPCWYLEDGRIVNWRNNEHCVLVTGFDDNRYLINDPWNNNGRVWVDKSLFERGHRAQLSQAAGIIRV